MDSWSRILFVDYYEELNGSNIVIDLKKRLIFIYSDNIKVSTVVFSNRVWMSFTIDDLKYKGSKLQRFTFFVYKNGYKNLNWLYVLVIDFEFTNMLFGEIDKLLELDNNFII